MGAKLYHITQSANVESILAHGLLMSPPVKNFATGPNIYLTDSIESARRWGGEIARQLGGPQEMTILEVDLMTAGCGPFVLRPTEIPRTRQACFRMMDFCPESIGVVDAFTAKPIRNKKRESAHAGL